MIKPTIGRVVLVRSHAGQIDPYPALVTKVWGDHCVNVAGFNDGGTAFAHSSCRLLQDDDPAPASGPYAYWMPYQKAQAEKHSTDTAAPLAEARKVPVVDAELPNRGARVTPADIEAEIAREDYINAGAATRSAGGPLNLLTLCVLTLRNGFTVVGKSACASAANYDEQIGQRIARADAVDQLWPLLGFRLRDKLVDDALADGLSV